MYMYVHNYEQKYNCNYQTYVYINVHLPKVRIWTVGYSDIVLLDNFNLSLV